MTENNMRITFKVLLKESYQSYMDISEKFLSGTVNESDENSLICLFRQIFTKLSWVLHSYIFYTLGVV